ncbi:hypothetical protein [Euzebya rosea]|uniref:hypothetical protein n=1 Tax=Euzebya rosea TaxID=2052804 RepID=UPI0013003DA5|nr:hypothetical protein [Euzebya rosea]
MRRVLTVLLLGLPIFALTTPPALAHGRGSDSTNFASTITARPDVDGLSWRVLNGDEYLELRNDSGAEVTVPGYTGEPYLRVGPDGVFRNLNSTATYLNEDRFGQSVPPTGLDLDAEPDWEQISTGSSYAWHDHRIHWMAQADPPAVAANPGTVQLVNTWTVPIAIGGEMFEVVGDLTWVPGDSPWLWLLPALVLLTVPILVAIRRTEPDREAFTWTGLSRVAGWIGLVIALANVVHLIDDLFATPLPLSESAVSAIQTLFFIAVAVFGCVKAIQSREGGFTALGVAVGAIFIGQGLLYFSVLGASQTASLFPGWLTRAIIAASVAQIVPLGAATILGTRALLPDFDEEGLVDDDLGVAKSA